MFLLLFVVFLFALVVFWVYYKLTIGICKCSRHLVGKVVIVTGGNTGIGLETAKDLADRGARVILACRDEDRGIAARNKIVSATGNSDIHYRHLDLASLNSVRKFAREFLQNEKRLDILINNAGIYGSDFVKTEDGLLLGMQVNHFAPFLLTNLLLPLLKSSAPSRIITLSSIAHWEGSIDTEDLNMENIIKSNITRRNVYSASKLCNILMTLELGRRLTGTGVTANVLHPGLVATEILNDINVMVFQLFLPVIKLYTKSAWEGAQTTIYLAVSPEVSGETGKYFEDCRMKNVIVKQARDPELARKLWNVSEKLVSLQ